MGTVKIKDIKNQEVTRGHGINYPLPKRLYTLPEAGHYLGRTVWSMRELIWAGKLPVVRSGKRIFLDVHDLDSYIEKNKSTYI
jgi:hypothetical protein